MELEWLVSDSTRWLVRKHPDGTVETAPGVTMEQVVNAMMEAMRTTQARARQEALDEARRSLLGGMPEFESEVNDIIRRAVYGARREALMQAAAEVERCVDEEDVRHIAEKLRALAADVTPA